MRVASLLPSATELVCAVGAKEQLVGVSHECDFPGDLGELPSLTSTRLGPPRSSAAIHAEVQGLIQDVLSVYSVEEEALRAARPDVIITQDLCDVCAVSRADVDRALCALDMEGVTVVNLSPTRLEHVLDDLERVGAALDRAEEAAAARAGLEARLEALRERAAPLERRSVLTLEWIDPLMVGGTWMPELIDCVGGEALIARAGEHAPIIEASVLEGLQPAPEVVVVKPCGFPLAKTLQEQGALRELLASLDWPAIRDGRVYLADGNAYFNRPGPRLVESAELLAACVHPEVFGEPEQRFPGEVARLELGA
ncbi:MAG: ABC transporter substrate-binding protein [Planctomycetes bacterium]|nr:ABC transporter substrate-binding protein [Planctomycetota bacterium]